MANSQRPANLFINLCPVLLGGVILLTASILNAFQDDKTPSSSAPIARRLFFVPLLPEVPPEETVDPEEIARLKKVEMIGNMCSKIASSLKNHVNPLPIIDWLNVSNLPSFFEPTIRSLLKREEYFNAIDSLGKYDLGVQPYGFFSSYKLDKDDFKLTTFGMTIDGAVTLHERWVVGGGLGYWHSNLDWGKHARGNDVNSIYGGPFAGYVFDQAYIGLTLLGVYNIYNINHLFEDEKGKKRHEGWDASARLEGGYDIEWTKYCGENFFVQPNADLSYLWVFQNKIEEEKALSDDETISSTIDSRKYDFFRTRLGVTFKKEFHHVEKGILIPSLSVGWVLMQPLSQSKISTTCNDSDEKTIKSKSYPSSNQCHVGAKVIAINKRGMMLSLGADAYIANLYPVYSGSLRFECSW